MENTGKDWEHMVGKPGKTLGKDWKTWEKIVKP